MTEIRLWIAKRQKSLHLYIDLDGPIQLLAKNGYKYVINFIDDFWPYNVTFLKTQVQYFVCYKEISS